MKRIFKSIPLLLAVIMIVSTMAACSGTTQSSTNAASETSQSTSPAEKISLRFGTNWGPGDSKYDYFQPLFDAFVEANQDVADITLETATTEDFKTKIRVDLASGNLADAFTYWGGAHMVPMIESDSLLDADEYFAASETVSKDQFDESSYGYYTYNGAMYGIPLEATRPVFLANSAIFEQYNLDYPTTYDELVSVAEVLNSNGIIPMAMGSKSGQPVEFFFSEIYNQYANAADELNQMSQTMNFATDNALKTATVLQDLIALDMFPQDTVANGDWGPCLQLYTEEKAAMTYTYPWMFEFIPQEIQDQSDCIAVPMMPDAVNDPATFVSGFTVYGFVINKASFYDGSKQDMLIKLCDFLASDEMTTELTKCGMIPAKKVSIDMSTASTVFKKMMDYVDGKNLTPVHYTAITDLDTLLTLDSSLDELLINALTPQAFVDKVQNEFDKVE